MKTKAFPFFRTLVLMLSSIPLLTGCGSSAPKEQTVILPFDIPLELVELPTGLLMGKYEVTQSQWEAVMGSNPSRFKGADNPVENVSWDDCQEFLKKLNTLPAVKESGLVFRLPTNKEWEYACRAGATGKYCKLADGTEIAEDTLGQVAWIRDNSENKTHPVGQKQPNAFGLHDMHGNVYEWCQEEYGEVESWAKGKDCEHQRGGGWYNWAIDCESSRRNGHSPSDWGGQLGFRLCASGRAD